MWTEQQLDAMFNSVQIIPCNFAINVIEGDIAGNAATILFVGMLPDGTDVVIPYAPALSKRAVEAMIQTLQLVVDEVTWEGAGELQILGVSKQ